MKRNDIVPLGNLRNGDRFAFPKKPNEVWQTTGAKPSKRNAVPYNKFRLDGNIKEHKFDKELSCFVQVKFLRHTQPAPGEQWLLNDLRVGDVFYLVGDVITEYQVIDTRTPTHDVLIRELNSNVTQPFEHCDVAVVFIRKAEEVKA